MHKFIETIKKNESGPFVIENFINTNEIKLFQELYRDLPLEINNTRQKIIKKKWTENFYPELQKIYFNKLKLILDDFKMDNPKTKNGLVSLGLFQESFMPVSLHVDTGFDFEHPQPTHGPKVNNPYFTAGEALKGADQVPFNNEHMNITAKTVEKLKLIPEGGNYTDIPRDHPLYVKGMISHVYRRINRLEPAKTIIAAGGGGTWGYHYPEPRALTNRERARLQSFPDSFIFEGTFTEIRRQIGNAVPPAGVWEVAKKLMPLFSGDYEEKNLMAMHLMLKKLPIKARLNLDNFQQRNLRPVKKTDQQILRETSE